MKTLRIGLILYCILSMIFICFLLFNKNKENIELSNKLVAAEQELSNAQKEIDVFAVNLQTEIDKNKNMEETISDLNLELSTANEKIVNMQDMGVHVYFTEEEVSYIAKTVYGEARGCSKIQQSAVVWCILNRLDNGYWGDSIKSVVTAKSQFSGYSASHPVTDEISELVEDVLYRWNIEKSGATNIGRTLPERFLYFHSDGTGYKNIFTTDCGFGEVWNWNCWNPYE